MSEPVVKQRPSIDLDDFERRLRQASAPIPGGRPADRNGDPLAELARLVGEPYDPFGDVFAGEAAASHHPHPSPPRGPHPVDPRSAGPYAQDPYAQDRREPGFAGGAPRLFGDFAAIEAGLRSSQNLPRDLSHDRQFAAPHDGVSQGFADPSSYGAQAGYPQSGYDQADYGQAGQQPLGGAGEWAGSSTGADAVAEGWDGRRRPDAAHARRPMMLMGVSIAVGVIGIGAAFALKGRVSSSPREIKTIMADASPTKIQPPPDAAPDGSGDGSVFGKAGQTTPGKLVSREEQPVDIAQAVQDNVARAAQMNPPTDASTVPVPPSPGQVQAQGVGRVDPIGEQTQGFGLAEIPAPKRVKVVSVRPDGTILPSDEPPAAAVPAPRQPAGRTSDRAGPVAKPSTPKPVTAKTTSRVASATKPADRSLDPLAGGADDAPATKPVRKPKPQRVASAEPADGAAETPAAEDNGGGFAVQLAAPGSEADAKAASSRLSKKFSDALGDHHIGFRRAESNGKSVYRVRVSSLSRADAVSLCEKLKADGGSCFVAKN